MSSVLVVVGVGVAVAAIAVAVMGKGGASSDGRAGAAAPPEPPTAAEPGTDEANAMLSGKMARKAAAEVVLHEAEGDVKEAAGAMGVSTEEFKKLVE